MATVVDWQAMFISLPGVLLDKLLASGHHVCRMTLEPVLGTYDRKRPDLMMKCRQ